MCQYTFSYFIVYIVSTYMIQYIRDSHILRRYVLKQCSLVHEWKLWLFGFKPLDHSWLLSREITTACESDFVIEFDLQSPFNQLVGMGKIRPVDGDLHFILSRVFENVSWLIEPGIFQKMWLFFQKFLNIVMLILRRDMCSLHHNGGTSSGI